MDDRELEARLRTHLHARFDATPVPSGLAGSVREVLHPVPATPVGFRFGKGALQLGWATLAAALVVAIIVFAQTGLGPAGPRPTPTFGPSMTPSPASLERWFVVLPAELTFSKSEASQATEVLDARLRALGYGTFATFGGFAIGFEIVPDGSSAAPTDEATRRVLLATGDVQVVPLPPSDYGNGGLEATVGQPLPKGEPALFGWEGIASFKLGTDQQSRTTLEMALLPATREAFADYTAAHVGESMAMVIDGRVASVTVINQPIPGGQVVITSGGVPGSAEERRFLEWASILAGGVLPESWRGASSPTVLTYDEAVAIALRAHPNGTVASADMYFAINGTAVAPIWRVGLSGTFTFQCGEPESSDCPSPWSFLEVHMHAVTGEVVLGD